MFSAQNWPHNISISYLDVRSTLAIYVVYFVIEPHNKKQSAYLDTTTPIFRRLSQGWRPLRRYLSHDSSLAPQRTSRDVHPYNSPFRGRPCCRSRRVLQPG